MVENRRGRWPYLSGSHILWEGGNPRIELDHNEGDEGLKMGCLLNPQYIHYDVVGSPDGGVSDEPKSAGGR